VCCEIVTEIDWIDIGSQRYIEYCRELLARSDAEVDCHISDIYDREVCK
jgi:hypothetical protein